MTDIIEFLYTNRCCKEVEPVSELDELNQKEDELFAQIQATLGLKILDELNYTQAKLSHQQELACFREGFRLGASLMLELL